MNVIGKFIDITGEKYGRLTAICPTDKRTKGGGYIWHFKCECGTEKDIPSNSVRTGLIKSCGCVAKPHGMTNTRLFNIWVDMRQRCDNPNSTNYNIYGGKGISVCDEWKDFKTFAEWSFKNGYDKNLSIDRIDGSKGYYPENCRWATNKQQARNQSRNCLITYNGETHCIAEWSEILGISSVALRLRLTRYNYTIEDAFTKPLRKSRKE